MKDKSEIRNPKSETAEANRQYLLRSQLAEDPNNPRTQFDAAKLKELADDLARNGVTADLIVRHPWPDEKVNGAQYVIVDGARRYRAAALAKIERLPVSVRKLTPDQVLRIQAVSTQKQVNLSALEEGRALHRELTARRAKDPKATVDQLADDLGLTRSTAYNRLALVRLTPTLTKALETGKIDTSIALVIASTPMKAEQEEILNEIYEAGEMGNPYSVRDLEDHIARHYRVSIVNPPFDLKKTYEGYIERDGKKAEPLTSRGPCGPCPFRTGNMVLEFPELKSNPNVCTDPPCCRAKCAAKVREALEAKAKAGYPILQRAEFLEVAADYQAETAWIDGETKSGRLNELMGKHAPKATFTTSEDGNLLAFFKKSEVKVALEKAGWEPKQAKKTQKPISISTPITKEDAAAVARAKATAKAEAEKCERERQELAVAIQRRRDITTAAQKNLCGAITKTSDKTALSIIEAFIVDVHYINPALQKQIVKPQKDALRRVVARVIGSNFNSPVQTYSGNWDKETVAIWKALGIDLVAEEKKAIAAAAAAKAKPKEPFPLGQKAGLPPKGKDEGGSKKGEPDKVAKANARLKAQGDKIRAKKAGKRGGK